MRLPKKHISQVPISTFIAISLIIIYLLFIAKLVTSLPCGKDILQVFMSNFVHIDTVHLISNLFALYAISRVEEHMGFQSFIWLVIFLLSFNTLVEYIAHKIWEDMKCSIGFSGVLFGLMTWELITTRKLDLELFLAIFVTVVAPSIDNEKLSLSGHAIGAVSGVLGGIIWKFINKDD